MLPWNLWRHYHALLTSPVVCLEAKEAPAKTKQNMTQWALPGIPTVTLRIKVPMPVRYASRIYVLGFQLFYCCVCIDFLKGSRVRQSLWRATTGCREQTMTSWMARQRETQWSLLASQRFSARRLCRWSSLYIKYDFTTSYAFSCLKKVAKINLVLIQFFLTFVVFCV